MFSNSLISLNFSSMYSVNFLVSLLSIRANIFGWSAGGISGFGGGVEADACDATAADDRDESGHESFLWIFD